jgi:Uncharacterised nucleotidyltransferase
MNTGIRGRAYGGRSGGLPPGVVQIGCLAPRGGSADCLRTLSGYDPEYLAALLRRHKVRLRADRILRSQSEPLLEPLRRSLEPYARVARYRLSAFDALIPELDRLGSDLEFAIFGIKGLAARRFYGGSADRDLGDADMFVATDSQAWTVASWFRSRGWSFDTKELPWLKVDQDSGLAYGQIRLVQDRSVEAGGVFADIHYGGYSVRHCGLYRLRELPLIPGWHEVAPQTNFVLAVANAAGDDFITLKDLNDLFLVLREGRVELDVAMDDLRAVGLDRFVAVMVRRLAELFDMSAIPPGRAEGLSNLGRSEPVPPLEAADRGMRLRVTVRHSFEVGRRHSYLRGVRAALTGYRYYVSGLRLRIGPSWRIRPRVPHLNSWTCIRLMPASGLANRGPYRRRSPGASRDSRLKTVSRLGAVRFVRTGRSVLTIAGGEVFVPTVYFRLSAAVVADAAALRAKVQSGDLRGIE